MPVPPPEAWNNVTALFVMAIGLIVAGAVAIKVIEKWQPRKNGNGNGHVDRSEVIIAKLDQIYSRVDSMAHAQHQYAQDMQKTYGDLVGDVVMLVQSSKK